MAMREQRSLTSSTMCVERMTTTFSPISASRLWKRTRSLGIETGGRLVDDDQFRIAEQRLRDAEALAHAAGEGAEVLLARVVEVRALQQRVDGVAPLARVDDPLQHREVIQHRLGA